MTHLRHPLYYQYSDVHWGISSMSSGSCTDSQSGLSKKMNSEVTSSLQVIPLGLLGEIIGYRNSDTSGRAEARQNDRSNHSNIKNAYKAYQLSTTQALNLLFVMCGLLIGVSLFVSPFHYWQTVWQAYMQNTGVLIHVLVLLVAIAFVSIGISRYRNVGSIGLVAYFLAREYVNCVGRMKRGYMLEARMDFLSSVTYSSIHELYEQWQRHLYVSLVKFARAILEDEKRYKGSSRGYLERAFVQQLYVAAYFNLASNLDDAGIRALREEIIRVAQGVSASRYLLE